jgi:hypothetical protein
MLRFLFVQASQLFGVCAKGRWSSCSPACGRPSPASQCAESPIPKPGMERNHIVYKRGLFRSLSLGSSLIGYGTGTRTCGGRTSSVDGALATAVGVRVGAGVGWPC